MSPGTARFINRPSKAGLEFSDFIIVMGFQSGSLRIGSIARRIKTVLKRMWISVELCLSPDPMIFLLAASSPRTNNEEHGACAEIPAPIAGFDSVVFAFTVNSGLAPPLRPFN